MINTKIPIYGILIIISLIVGIFVIYKNLKLIKLTKEETLILFIYILIGSIFGAKYFAYFTDIKMYSESSFLEYGLSSYGAVIGVLLLTFIFSKQIKIDYKKLIYIIMPALPIMYAIGKIGCFLVGCCHGIEYSGPFSVIYNYSTSAQKNISYFPVQIIETISFLAIFIYLENRIKKEKANYILISKMFIYCGIAKFSLDYLRASHVNQFLSINQIISILFIISGLCFIYSNKKKSVK